MNRDELLFWLTVASAGCWIVCFWWMRRISVRQDALLVELRDQTRRIEQLSKAEHDLIQEVHPQVGQIKHAVEEVAAQTKAHDGVLTAGTASNSQTPGSITG